MRNLLYAPLFVNLDSVENMPPGLVWLQINDGLLRCVSDENVIFACNGPIPEVFRRIKIQD